MKITDKIKETLGDESFGKLKDVIGGKNLYLLDDKDYIPKTTFNTLNEENKTLKAETETFKTKIAELEKGAKDKDQTVESQLAELQTQLKKFEDSGKEKDALISREKKLNLLKEKLTGAQINQKFVKHALSEFEVEKLDFETEDGVKAVEEKVKSVATNYPEYFGKEVINGNPPNENKNLNFNEMKEVSTEDYINEIFKAN